MTTNYVNRKLCKSYLLFYWSLMCKVNKVQVNKVQIDSRNDFVRGPITALAVSFRLRCDSYKNIGCARKLRRGSPATKRVCLRTDLYGGVWAAGLYWFGWQSDVVPSQTRFADRLCKIFCNTLCKKDFAKRIVDWNVIRTQSVAKCIAITGAL